MQARLPLFFAALLLPRAAAAQEDPCQPDDRLSTCIASDNLWIHPGSFRQLSAAPAETVPAGSVTAGVAVGYLHRPIGLTISSANPDGTTVYAVENVVSSTVTLGVGITDRLQFNLAAPAVLLQEGAAKADVVGSDEVLARSAVGDFRFGTSLGVLRREADRDGVALALRFDMAAPTGDEGAFAGAPSATFAPGASVDGRIGRVRLGVDVGARLKDDTVLADAVIGSQVSASLGGSVAALDDGLLTIGLEAFGLLTIHRQLERSVDPVSFEVEEESTGDMHLPAEWLLSVHNDQLLDGAVRFSLAGGSFIPTGSKVPVTTPAFRFMSSMQYRFVGPGDDSDDDSDDSARR
jgi:hypothetical protein